MICVDAASRLNPHDDKCTEGVTYFGDSGYRLLVSDFAPMPPEPALDGLGDRAGGADVAIQEIQLNPEPGR